ncbi:MAG: lytic transglycosylase domain-containing protein [Ruminococcaceae bacterium]|nr:lytic transglycosylase domain-containing protein [Oscillospiraceae bacterium]
MSKRRKRRSPKALLALLLALLILIPALSFAIEPIEKQIFPLPYADLIEEVANQYNFPPSLIYAVIYTESKFDPQATSSAEAHGLMQITDSTYQWACKRSGQKAQDTQVLYDPETNIRFGVLILSLLRERFKHTETVLAAYNAGQGKVAEWLKDPAYSKDGTTLHNIPYEETENYVHRVINTQKRYQKLYNIL